jgi:hypothetical protein
MGRQPGLLLTKGRNEMTQPPESGPSSPQWGPPPPQGGPPPNQWGPPPPQGGPQARGPSRRTLWLVVAGVGVLIAVIVAVAGGQHPSQPAPGQSGPGQPAPSGHQSAAPQPGKHDPSKRSPAYQQGYEWGNQHMGPSPDPPAFSCDSAAGYRFKVARRDLPDWVQGCVDGIADMAAEPGAPTFSLPTVPDCPYEDLTKC